METCHKELIRKTTRITVAGLAANFVLAVVKFLVGLRYSSQALIADALHSLTDSITDIVIIIGVRFWSAPADSDHPHGHGRIETMVSFLLGLSVAFAAVAIGMRALASLQQPQIGTTHWAVFLAACFSVAIKELLYQWHSRVGRSLRSTAIVANAWHHRSDAFSSLIVALAAASSWFLPEWSFLDQAAALIVAVLILQAAWGISIPAFKELIDTGASEEQHQRILRLAQETAQVLEVHALRTRKIANLMHVDLHVQVDPNISVLEGHAIAGQVKARILEQEPNVAAVLVHLEPFEKV